MAAEYGLPNAASHPYPCFFWGQHEADISFLEGVSSWPGQALPKEANWTAGLVLRQDA